MKIYLSGFFQGISPLEKMDNAFQVVRAKFRKSASAQNILIKDISHPLKYFIFDVDTKFSTLSELCLLFEKFVPLPIKFVNLNTPNSSLKKLSPSL